MRRTGAPAPSRQHPLHDDVPADWGNVEFGAGHGETMPLVERDGGQAGVAPDQPAAAALHFRQSEREGRRPVPASRRGARHPTKPPPLPAVRREFPVKRRAGKHIAAASNRDVKRVRRIITGIDRLGKRLVRAQHPPPQRPNHLSRHQYRGHRCNLHRTPPGRRIAHGLGPLRGGLGPLPGGLGPLPCGLGHRAASAIGVPGSANFAGSTGARDFITARMSEWTSQTLTFIPAATRPSLSQKTQNSPESRLPRYTSSYLSSGLSKPEYSMPTSYWSE